MLFRSRTGLVYSDKLGLRLDDLKKILLSWGPGSYDALVNQDGKAPDDSYRTTPLRGLFTRSKGGFYHDGRFADLNAVVDHYKGVLKFNLSPDQQRDLVEYLKSL